MRARVSAEYGLSDFDVDPDEITAYLGLAPTRAWRVGQQVSRPPALPARTSGWGIETPEDRETGTEVHLARLLGQLEPAWDRLVELGRRYAAGINLVAYVYDEVPALYVSEEVVRRAAELNVSLGVDLYLVEAHQGE